MFTKVLVKDHTDYVVMYEYSKVSIDISRLVKQVFVRQKNFHNFSFFFVISVFA